MSTTRNTNYLELLVEEYVYDGVSPSASSDDTLDMASAERMYRTLRDVLNDHLQTRDNNETRLRIADMEARLEASNRILQHQREIRSQDIDVWSEQVRYARDIRESLTTAETRLTNDSNAVNQRILTNAAAAYAAAPGDAADKANAAWNSFLSSYEEPGISHVSEIQLPGTLRLMIERYQTGEVPIASWSEDIEDIDGYQRIGSIDSLSGLETPHQGQLEDLIRRSDDTVASRNLHRTNIRQSGASLDELETQLGDEEGPMAALDAGAFSAETLGVLNSMSQGQQYNRERELAEIRALREPSAYQQSLEADMDYLRQYMFGGEEAPDTLNTQAETIRRLVESGWAEEAGVNVERLGRYSDNNGDGIIDSYAPGVFDEIVIMRFALESLMPRRRYGVLGLRSGRTGMAVQLNVRPEGDALTQLQNQNGEYSYTVVDGQPVLLSPGAAQQRISAAEDPSRGLLTAAFSGEEPASLMALSVNPEGEETSLLVNQNEDGSYEVFAYDDDQKLFQRVADEQIDSYLNNLAPGDGPEETFLIEPTTNDEINEQPEDERLIFVANRAQTNEKGSPVVDLSSELAALTAPPVVTSSELPEGIQYGKNLIPVIGERARVHARDVMNYPDGAIALADGTIFTSDQIVGPVTGVQVLNEDETFNVGGGIFRVRTPLEEELMRAAVDKRDPRSTVSSSNYIDINVHQAPKGIREPIIENSGDALAEGARAFRTDLFDRFRRPEPIDADIEPRITPPEQEAVAEPEPEEVPEEEVVAEKTPMPKKAPVAEEVVAEPEPEERVSLADRLSQRREERLQRPVGAEALSGQMADQAIIDFNQIRDEFFADPSEENQRRLQSAYEGVQSTRSGLSKIEQRQPRYSGFDQGFDQYLSRLDTTGTIDLPEDTSKEIAFSGVEEKLGEPEPEQPPTRQGRLARVLRDREKDFFAPDSAFMRNLPRRRRDIDLEEALTEAEEAMSPQEVEDAREQQRLDTESLALGAPVAEEEPRSERVQNFVRNLGSGQNLADFLQRRRDQEEEEDEAITEEDMLNVPKGRPTVESNLSISPTEQEEGT